MGKQRTELSELQSRMCKYIGRFIDEHNYSPSVRDIQNALSVSSTSVVDYNLKKLEERGLIRRDKNISRAMGMVEKTSAPRTLRIPLAPTPIAAGTAIPVLEELLAAGNWEPMEISPLHLGRYSGHPEELYALRVKGYSMIEDLINDGDIVVMHSQQTAEVGQTIAAWLRAEQSVTLKRYYPEGQGRVRLQPANETMDPIYTNESNLEIKGRLVCVVRQLA